MLRDDPTWGDVEDAYGRGIHEGMERAGGLLVVVLLLGLLAVTLAGCCSRRPSCPDLGSEVYAGPGACDPRTPAQRASCCGSGLPPCEVR